MSSSSNLWFVGAILAILASMSGTAGKQLFRFSELQQRKGTLAGKYVGKVTLLLGLILNTVVGPLIDMASYAFAPQSLIAPLGALDVVWNTLSAPFTLGETLTKKLVLGCALIFCSAVITSIVGSRNDSEFTLEEIQGIFLTWRLLGYMAVLAVWLAFNMVVLMPRSAAPKGEPWQSGDPIRGLSLGMTAGSIAGNMFCVKAFAEVVQGSIVNSGDAGVYWSHWLPYVLLVVAVFFAVSNLYFLNKAMREYEALFMGAVFEGSLIFSACVSGYVVFDDTQAMRPWEIVIYWLALLGILVGIFVVARGAREKAALSQAQEVAAEKLVDSDAGPVRIDSSTGEPRSEKDKAAALAFAGRGSPKACDAHTADALASFGAAYGNASPDGGNVQVSPQHGVLDAVLGTPCVFAERGPGNTGQRNQKHLRSDGTGRRTPTGDSMVERHLSNFSASDASPFTNYPSVLVMPQMQVALETMTPSIATSDCSDMERGLSNSHLDELEGMGDDVCAPVVVGKGAACCSSAPPAVSIDDGLDGTHKTDGNAAIMTLTHDSPEVPPAPPVGAGASADCSGGGATGGVAAAVRNQSSTGLREPPTRRGSNGRTHGRSHGGPPAGVHDGAQDGVSCFPTGPSCAISPAKTSCGAGLFLERAWLALPTWPAGPSSERDARTV